MPKASCVDQSSIEALGPSFWRERLAPYSEPRVGRGVLDLATSVVPYLMLTAAAYALLQVSDLFALAFAVLAAGFLVRTFIVFHDCTHGSFFRSRTANKWVGVVLRVDRVHAVSHLAARARNPPRHSRRPRPSRHGRHRNAHGQGVHRALQAAPA